MRNLARLGGISHSPRCCWYVKSLLFSFCVNLIKGDDGLTKILPFEAKRDEQKWIKTLQSALQDQNHENTQVENNTLPFRKLALYKLHYFIVIQATLFHFIWNLSVFRRELLLEVELMHTTYWIVVMWWLDRGFTWHVGWGILILVTTLLSLRLKDLLKVEI